MQAQHQNKGTLIPGQIITVGQHQVQVEKYLSQGGFAHVYLVRTPQPVYGTTHHVLKRIAVANDAMMEEVKKEVSIMRILRGHPNIVYLIDAAYNQMLNGMYEAFVLMEFCQGGGIIDMMNRRLRERLTEAEILTVFVDVCEGVAAMHNLKPALLHRDLKVENILQSSATSYKLCDFGSTAPVAPRPPSSTQEIRMLEADLNRHTTLQYRAPEMVDAYLRRPIDEKSDVWALGVLLYKLCYYTTPFEEHGPLAILNVQYRIPPYPVYSAQMNTLIGSMLREHGTQRPSVFEILNVVHSLRGSKSRFTYNIPMTKPLSPTSQRAPANALDGVVAYRPKSSAGVTSPRNNVEPGAGLQARAEVLEAIAPMRRGRPQGTSPLPTGASPSPAPIQSSKSGAAQSLEGLNFGQSRKGEDDAWKVLGSSQPSATDVGSSNSFGDSFDGSTASAPQRSNIHSRPHISTNISSSQNRVPTMASLGPSKDAFAGLGLNVPDRKVPTLGEARKTRTGLASMGSYSSPRDQSGNANFSMGLQSSARPPSSLAAPAMPPRPTASPKPRPSSMLGPPSPKPHATSAPPSVELSTEDRFPSLEALDRQFDSTSSKKDLPAGASVGTKSDTSTSSSRIALGMAMRDTPKWMTDFQATSHDSKPLPQGDYLSHATRDRPQIPGKPSNLSSRSSTLDKTASPLEPEKLLDISGVLSPPTSIPNRKASPVRQPQDWLTGDDDSAFNVVDSRKTGENAMNPPGTPVLRESPSKRASYIQESGIKFQSPKHASPQQATTRASPAPILQPAGTSLGSRFTTVSNISTPPSPSKNRTRAGQAISTKSSGSSDDGPEDAHKGRYTRTTSSHRNAQQGSVHDLADRYGAVTTGRSTPTPKGFAGAHVQRRRSAVYPSATGRTSPSKPKSFTPQTALPASRSGSPTKRPPSASRKQASGTDALPYSRTVASPTSPTTGRSRPQSMFIHPMNTSKSAGPDAAMSPPHSSSGAPAASSNLKAPAEPRMRAQRRSSISDMVQMYESMTGPGHQLVAAPKPTPPPVANKPLGLKVGTSHVSSSSSMPPPSSPSLASAAARFPALSPSNSPVLSRSELMAPAHTPQISTNANGRTSPNLIRRASPLLGSPAPEPFQPGPPPPLDVNTMMSLSATKYTPSGEGQTDIRSPSPDKPYQGVGKLIDRWQRNIADASPGVAGGPRAMNSPKRGGDASRR